MEKGEFSTWQVVIMGVLMGIILPTVTLLHSTYTVYWGPNSSTYAEYYYGGIYTSPGENLNLKYVIEEMTWLGNPFTSVLFGVAGALFGKRARGARINIYIRGFIGSIIGISCGLVLAWLQVAN